MSLLNGGGQGVLVGGSGPIEQSLFQDTVSEITEVAIEDSSIPVWILPGHPDQIPKRGQRVKGILNYKYIMGSEGNTFDEAYPPQARNLMLITLQSGRIPSLSTLYILCGDPNASVTKVSGILPLDLTQPSVNGRFVKDMNYWLQNGIECAFFESGSGSLKPANRSSVVQTRQLIDQLKTQTTLFVSGGIRRPAQAKLFAGIADYIVVGGHFERNGVKDTPEFIVALKA